MADFKEITTMKYWCQKVLPLVYDDSLSYYELLNKVVLKLNDLIENNKQLPDYISKLIQEYISSGAIGEVVRNILTEFMLNIKNPPNNLKPAVGDGAADDTEAIQGCIDYANSIGGGCVYVPNGVYLTQSLTLYDNVSLFGFDRYSSRLVLKGGATKPMFTGNVTNTSLTGLTIDGNMDIQVNNINLIDINADELILQNLVLTDGYVLVNTTVNKSTQISDVICDYSVVQHMNLSGSGLVLGSNIYLHDISKLKGTNLVTLNNNNSVLSNIVSNGEAPVGFLINGNNNSVSGTFDNAVVPFEDRGTNNTIINNGKTEQLKITGNRTNSVGGNETSNINGKYEINAENIKLNPTQPLEYKEPTELNEYFKTIQFKHGNENYDVLVKGGQGVKEKLDSLNEAIEQEVVDRKEAIDNLVTQDGLLEDKINNEITNRESGDNALDEKIDTAIEELKISIDGVGVSVRKYGAKGDGITDDSDAIQRAFDSENTVIFPDGEYKVTKPLLINKSNVRVSGGSNAWIMYHGQGTDTYLLRIEGTNAKDYIKNIVIEGIKMNGSNQVYKGGASMLDPKVTSPKPLYNGFLGVIHGAYVENLVIKNCVMYDFYGDGIKIIRSHKVTVSDNFLYDVSGGNPVPDGPTGWDTTGDGIVEFFCRDVVFSNNTLMNTRKYQDPAFPDFLNKMCGRSGLEFEYNTDTDTTGSADLEHNAPLYGLYTPPRDTHGLVMDNNYVYGYTKGIHLEVIGGGAVISNNTLFHNYIGTICTTSARVKLIGNYYCDDGVGPAPQGGYDAYHFGIGVTSFESGGGGATIIGNVFKATGLDLKGVIVGKSNTVVMGNTFDNCGIRELVAGLRGLQYSNNNFMGGNSFLYNNDTVLQGNVMLNHLLQTQQGLNEAILKVFNNQMVNCHVEITGNHSNQHWENNSIKITSAEYGSLNMIEAFHLDNFKFNSNEIQLFKDTCEIIKSTNGGRNIDIAGNDIRVNVARTMNCFTIGGTINNINVSTNKVTSTTEPIKLVGCDGEIATGLWVYGNVMDNPLGYVFHTSYGVSASVRLTNYNVGLVQPAE